MRQVESECNTEGVSHTFLSYRTSKKGVLLFVWEDKGKFSEGGSI